MVFSVGAVSSIYKEDLRQLRELSLLRWQLKMCHTMVREV
jgi:hypothetical protein